ncbi:hypothetical protein cypCar_00026966 [Cyprinus carpio]|nr:hypothetical protein cypCar_00026966 [Cyprinus carpio]
MAFMEQQPQPMSGRKPPLDDTVPLIAVIEASQSLQSHTVTNSALQQVSMFFRSDPKWEVIEPLKDHGWRLRKRWIWVQISSCLKRSPVCNEQLFTNFDLIQTSLCLTFATTSESSLYHSGFQREEGHSGNQHCKISGLNLPLPPKKLLGNMDREFIAERQKGLQAYLNYITRHHILSSCELVKKFLDTNNYSANYTGWRLRKRYFLVKDKDQPKDKQVLSWVDLGPDKFLSDKDLLSAMKLLPTLSHSNISPVTFATTSESSALVIRVFSEKGTLRDHICKVKPKEPFLKKYCNPKKIQGLEQQQIQTYGRQILEALKFLHDKGFPYGHLHASNVLIEENTCKLLDIENSLLGLPSYYRPYVTQFRKINTTESIDVYSFGHLLYEMTYGRPPDAVPVDQYPPPPFSSVVSVLQSILSTEACKTGMPTVSQLLQTPLFSDVLLFNSEKPQFKISSKLKEALKSSKESLEKRLVEEQRTVSALLYSLLGSWLT